MPRKAAPTAVGTTILDAGAFIALGNHDQIAFALLRHLKLRDRLAVAATTIGEFWRSERGLSESRFGLIRPIAIPVDEPLAKRAGELLKRTRGANTLDAIVVALAERIGEGQILTPDVEDIECLLEASHAWECEVVAI